jgi:CheY-like chemotaxis protein
MTPPNLYLIVDDIPVNLFILKKYINILQPDAIVVEAPNGHDAIEAFEGLMVSKYKITSIIMDYNMPDMNGVEVLEEMDTMYFGHFQKTLEQDDIYRCILTANEVLVHDDIPIHHKPLNKKLAKILMNLKDYKS